MNEDAELEFAGFWSRTGAAIIDTILTMLIVIPILVGIYGTAYFSSENFIEGSWDFLLSWVLPAFATILFWIYRAATPGKMVIKAKIVDAKTGKAASTGQWIGRSFADFVSMAPLFLGIFWVGFDKRKQGWHDKLAGTVVVKRKNTGPEPVMFTN
jgi:uncharacterized RDD family membrane protein YckC